ncbi:hypothetical protein [Moraxella lacunata]
MNTISILSITYENLMTVSLNPNPIYQLKFGFNKVMTFGVWFNGP